MAARSRSTMTAATLLACGALAFAASPALASPAPVRTVGIATVDGSGGAWTYSASQLPEGARLTVTAVYPGSGSTIVTLHLTGAGASREYGAHAHKAACTSVSADALGHYQFAPNPNPLNPTDPEYANSSNEIWLDIHTNPSGNGYAQAVVPWQPGTSRPMSVVIHEMHTSTESGTAGTAGSRLGCMTVPF